ncbi:hypothetical protein [Mycobacterium sp. OTB74]|uniref:hypothetical protein n=1 Tax=Mycobacterium sp. OTB74 TaxID=1853452 RepID=UPI00247345BD|nr:hypothetical protein [Mycobacterium sp. OTB74]MDH6243982.1 hypothetical protein [Mycobacterium sp. OTB74]
MPKRTRRRLAVLLGALGVSMLGALAVPGVAAADPWRPWWSGPEHPVRHYVGDVEHPIWAVTHPIRALTP